MITVTVNGKEERLAGPTTVAAFVQGLPVNRRHVAVARNGEVVPRHQWGSETIEEGDVIEVVRMVGGGSRGARPCAPTSG